MRRVVVLCCLLALAGCQNIVGPFRPRPYERVDDPRITPEEQAARARAFLGYPEENRASGPRTANPAPLTGPLGALP